MTDPVAQTLSTALAGRYRIEALLGAGGMAVVYRAHDLRHDRAVAIKVLRPELASSLGPDRFLREIRIAARLQHPHILGLIDSGEVPASATGAPLLYYVMPFVEGESLREHIQRTGPVPLGQSIRWLREVAGALARAHRAGIVHRDIKPDNILLSDGHALVADFGVARAVRDAAAATSAHTALGVAVGTPAYMAPEQVAADPNVDHRADLYALGMVGYQMITGRLPFEASTPHLLLAAQVTATPDPITRHRPDTPPVLADAIMRCLAKDPAARFQSAEELAARLDLLSTGTGEVGALPRRGPARWAWAAAAGALLVAAAALWRARPSGTAPGADYASLAVLPLVNLSRDSASDYLSDGLTEEILRAVSRIPGLRVAARTSAFAFRDQTVAAPELAARLRVRHLLEGSVEQSGERVRVRARLVDGERNTEIWNDRFDHQAGDLFALQDSVAGAIARALTSRMRAGPPPPATPARPVAREAYDAYLRGLQALRRRAGAADLQRAIGHFETAIASDSGFARAWAGLASAWVLLPEYGGPPAGIALPAARRAISSALALDSTSGEVLAALGYVRRSFEWDWAGAEAAFRQALVVDPNAATVWQWLGETLDAIGRYPEAEEALARAETLDPVSPVVRLARGSHYLAAGDRPRGRAELHRALELQPGYWPASVQLLLLDLAERRLEDARALLAGQAPFLPFDPAIAEATLTALATPAALPRALEVLDPWAAAGTTPVIVVASFYAMLGQTDRAFAALTRGVERREPLVTLIRWWPALEPLHRDPRFPVLLERMGLPPLR